MDHHIEPELLNRRVQVHLVGAGGNGAQMAACLARLDIAMRALGHPGGLHVTAFDPDRVSETNVGRQLYSRADVGCFKALVTPDPSVEPVLPGSTGMRIRTATTNTRWAHCETTTGTWW